MPPVPHDLAKFGALQSVLIFRGVLFHAQHSSDCIVPDSERYPTGHKLHDDAAVAFENVSAAHSRHGESLGVGLNDPGGQDVHSEVFVSFGAYP